MGPRITSSKLSLGVNECVSVCMLGPMQLTGIPSKAYSHQATSVPRIGSGSITTLTLKRLLRMNELISQDTDDKMQRHYLMLGRKKHVQLFFCLGSLIDVR